jgi:hypothetical protein
MLNSREYTNYWDWQRDVANVMNPREQSVKSGEGDSVLIVDSRGETLAYFDHESEFGAITYELLG